MADTHYLVSLIISMFVVSNMSSTYSKKPNPLCCFFDMHKVFLWNYEQTKQSNDFMKPEVPEYRRFFMSAYTFFKTIGLGFVLLTF